MSSSILYYIPKLPWKSALNRTPVLASPTSRLYASGHGFGGSKVLTSPEEGPRELYTEVEKSYAEWKYVEKLLPLKYIPEPPKDPSKVFPSGWKPAAKTSPHAQYHIERTKNHQPAVFMRMFVLQRGQRRWTQIKNVEGNIWALEADIGAHLKKLYPGKVIRTWINESYRKVYINGDYEEAVREWVVAQGF